MTAVVDAPADRGRRLRAARALVVGLVVAAASGLLLAACSNAGTTFAQAACVHVDTSIHLYEQAEHAKSTAAARTKVDRAASELSAALPLAAQANSADPAYNPLMTTLQEIGRTSEANLIPALRAQCAAAQNPTSQSPVPGVPTSGTEPAGTGAPG